MIKPDNLRAILLASACSIIWVSPAFAGSFDIPGGDLQSALKAYSAQSGVPVVVSDATIRGARTKGIKGELPPAEALSRILRGTGFTTSRDPSGVIAIVPGGQSSDASDIQLQPMHLAQAAPPRSTVETVTVTSSKLGGADVQSIPISITALSQEQLTSTQTAGGPDLVKQVPNLTFTKTNFSGYSIQIRGIGTQAVSVTTDPAVAVAFNDIPFIRNHFFEQEFYDLAQVEVLRGPQGTLYGRNATAGVINLTSAKPTDEYAASLSVDVGNYNNRRFEGMVNLPIVPDKLEIRLAGEWTKRDGYTTDTTLNTPVDGRDLWSGRATLAFKPTDDFEADLVWEHFSEDDNRLRSGKQLCQTAQPPSEVDGQPVPSPLVGVPGGVLGNAGVLGQQYLSQGCQATSLYSASAFQVPYGPSLPYVVAAGYFGILNSGVDPYADTTQSTNLRSIQSALLPEYRAKNDTLELNANYNINSALTLTSQTGFNQDFLWSTEDYNRFDTTPGIFQYAPSDNLSFPSDTGVYAPNPAGYLLPDPAIPGAAIFCDPQLGCSDRLVAQDLNTEHAWQLSQEFRLSSSFTGPFNFSIGGNYLHYETEENYYVFVNALTAYSHESGVSGTSNGGGYSSPGKSNCLFYQSRFNGGYQNPNPLSNANGPVQSCVYIDPNPIGSLDNKGHNYFLSQNPYTLNSYAMFGEFYYSITPTLKLTTGLRWTVDQKHFIDIPSELVDEGYGFWESGIENQTWERPTGRAVLDWTPTLDFTDQTLLYASYSHGYKAGGANPPGAIFPQLGGGGASLPSAAFVDHPLTFKPEYIEALELGTKNTLLNGKLTLNADVFYYNYTGYQISEIVDRTAINNNYNAHVEGAELESTWEPTPGLRFNFAGGWEQTTVAGGESGIDLMDRTAGIPGWMVVKPFPTNASNCILPDYVVAALLQEQAAASGGTIAPFACRLAYTDHLDPVTGFPYAPNPTGLSANLPDLNNGSATTAPIPANYPGFNPSALVNGKSNNNGEGFLKNLAGHQLPNAPPFTLSVGSQYTIPVSSNWAATLRGDFYWQADSWARIFNDNPYDRLHGYTNLNLALILNSSDGWQVMGYVKNVFDTTAITGDFLNSDDSGLTTNVFLTDPRLFGVRVTKDFEAGERNGGYGVPEFLQNLFSDTDGKRPTLWIELGGQLEHIAGQGAAFSPDFLSTYATSSILQQHTTPLEAQRPPLFSAGEDATVTFQPEDSDWVVAASVRYGRSSNKRDVHHQTDKVHYQTYQSGNPVLNTHPNFTQEKFVDTRATHAESHSIMDFMAGKDVGLGTLGLDGSSVLSAGVRFAQFSSQSSVDMRARPDLHWKYFPSAGAPTHFVNVSAFHTYHATERASRKFRGIGPSLSWTGSVPVVAAEAGGLDVDWGANAAVLFGRQKTNVHHQGYGRYWPKGGSGLYSNAYLVNPTTGDHNTNRSVAVPNVGGFAGLSWRFDNAKVSFGYRADFFFGAIDGGTDKPKSETLGFMGPFATVSVGLGG